MDVTKRLIIVNSKVKMPANKTSLFYNALSDIKYCLFRINLPITVIDRKFSVNVPINCNFMLINVDFLLLLKLYSQTCASISEKSGDPFNFVWSLWNCRTWNYTIIQLKFVLYLKHEKKVYILKVQFYKDLKNLNINFSNGHH